MNRLVLLALLGLFVWRARGHAQSYECAGTLGTQCRSAIHDGWHTENGASRSGSATSTLLVLPGACAQADRIVDVDLGVHVLHPYIGDLEIALSHPDGTSVSVLYRPGIGAIEGNCPNDDLDVSFDDEDGVIAFDLCRGTIPALRGSVLPFNPLSLLNGKARNGTWTLTLRDHVAGNEGVLLGWKLDLPCVPDLPDISVDTTDAVVSERGPDDRAIVTVARGGDTSRGLEVRYMVTGSASLADFEPLPGSIQLPAGAATADIEIRAIEDDADERDETIVVTVLPSTSYELGARDSAFVTLVETSDVPAADASLGERGDGGPGPRAGGTGGTGGTTGNAEDPRDAGDAGRGGRSDGEDGCSCRGAGRATPGGDDFPAVLLLGAALMFAQRRRRPRSVGPRSDAST